MPEAGDYPTIIDGFGIYRREVCETSENCSENCFYEPMITMIVQGEKNSLLGSKSYTYKEGDYLITSIDIPTVNTMIGATKETPFLSLSLKIDRDLINQLLIEFPEIHKNSDKKAFKGIVIDRAENDLEMAFYRLMQLLDKPSQVPALAPLIIKEIHYLLLIGSFGEALSSINTPGTQSHHIAATIRWLKEHYQETVRMEDLASKANMSLSSFYRHFKEVTSLTPLQFQKQLRLHEARRLMLSENMTASRAALEVGYESATQFNREYKRIFQAPPRRDIGSIS